MKTTESITYTLKSADIDFVIDLVFDKKDFSLKNPPLSKKEWTKLTNQQCSHCTLSEEQSPLCPLANAIDGIISQLDSVLSYEEVQASATFRNRTVSALIPVQTAVSSLLGLIIPSSGCPHLFYFRPLCRFHQPFATVEETIFRSSSMFLMVQYFLNRENGNMSTNLERLKTIYHNVHLVNRFICQRLRKVSTADCSINAIVLLDMFSLAIQTALKHNLEEFQSYFSIYSDDSVFNSGS